MTDDLPALFQYHRWADERILSACRTLSDDQYRRDLGGSFPSVRATVAHLAGAAGVWRRRLDGEMPTSVPGERDFPSVDALAASLLADDDYFARYVVDRNAEQLAADFVYRNTKNVEQRAPLWAVLRHLVNHGTYHRGQIATMVRRLGAQPPTTDLIAWAVEKTRTD
jgi:uncharacterized damage-inducible protein DinB